jgi:hypothetical protein
MMNYRYVSILQQTTSSCPEMSPCRTSCERPDVKRGDASWSAGKAVDGAAVIDQDDDEDPQGREATEGVVGLELGNFMTCAGHSR